MPAYKVTFKVTDGKEQWIDWFVVVAEDQAHALVQCQKVADVMAKGNHPVVDQAAEIPNGVTFAFTSVYEFGDKAEQQEESKIILA